MHMSSISRFKAVNRWATYHLCEAFVGKYNVAIRSSIGRMTFLHFLITRRREKLGTLLTYLALYCFQILHVLILYVTGLEAALLVTKNDELSLIDSSLELFYHEYVI